MCEGFTSEFEPVREKERDSEFGGLLEEVRAETTGALEEDAIEAVSLSWVIATFAAGIRWIRKHGESL